MSITKEDLDRIKLNYYSGIVRREDGWLMITAIDQVWAELEALKAKVGKLEAEYADAKTMRRQIPERKTTWGVIENITADGLKKLTREP